MASELPSNRLAHDKPPFIASQALLALAEDAPDPRRRLHPATFRAARRQRQAGRDGQPPDPESRYWHAIDRRTLFLEQNWDRLCLTTDAGIGKSTTLLWIRHALQQHDRSLLALLVELRDLPTSSAGFLPPRKPPGRRAARKNPALLVKLLRDVPANAAFDEEQIGDHLRRLIGERRLVLLVDAIDQSQALRQRGGNPKVVALRDFLHGEGHGCRALVAGRPHAIDRYWDDLFAEGPWRFAQLDHFSKAEQQAYLGTERYKLLKNLGLDILSIPRALEVIRQNLTLDQLHTLQTGSDVYWECIKTMLQRETRSVVRVD
jgi:hypothetical protein